MTYTIKWIHGFRETTGAGLDGVWEERTGQWISATARDGGQAWQMGEVGGDAWARKDLSRVGVSPFDEFIVSAAVKFDAGAHTGDARLFSLYEGAGTTLHMSLGYNNSPVDLKVFRGTTQVGTTLDTNLSTGVWYHIQFAGKIHDTTGYFEVFVNNVSTTAQTSLDTRNAGTTGLASHLGVGFVTTVSGGPLITMGDLNLATGTPGTPFGDLRVDRFIPTGAGNSTQFTPLSSTNTSNVDEINTDSDTTYNQSSTTGHKDLFTFADIPSGATIHAVQQGVIHRKTDAGARTLRTLARSGSTDYEGSDITLHDSYEITQQCRTVDPNTSSAWTESGVNALEIGYKVES